MGPSQAAEPTVDVAAPALVPVGEEIAGKVAADYVAAVTKGDRAAAVALVEARYLLPLGMAGSSVPAAAWKDAKTEAGVASAIVDEHLSLAKAGSVLRVLGPAKWGDGDWVTIGVVHPSGALDQYKVRVAKPEADPVIVDLWTLSSGMSRSQDAARTFGIVAGTDPDAEALLKVSEQLQLGNFDAAWRLVKSAPEPLKSRRDLLILGADAARRLEPKKHAQAVEALLAAHPEDPAARLRGTLVASEAEDHAGAAAHFEWLQDRVGPDGYLYVVTSSAWRRAGDLDKARAAVEAGVDREPQLLEGWVQLALVAADQGDATATERALIKLQTRFGVSPGMFEGPAYDALRASEGFKRWAASAG